MILTLHKQNSPNLRAPEVASMENRAVAPGETGSGFSVTSLTENLASPVPHDFQSNAWVQDTMHKRRNRRLARGAMTRAIGVPAK